MSEKIAVEKYQIIQLRRKYYSCKKLKNFKNNEHESPISKSNKLITNLVDINKSSNNIDINSQRNKNEYINLFKYEDIYNKIKLKLEKFIEKNSKKNKLVFLILNKIYSFIDFLLSKLTGNNIEEINSSKTEKGIKEEQKNDLLKFNSKIKYELKKKIKELNKEIESINMNNEENKKTCIYSRNTEPNYSLKKKILQLESKIKLNEFKYLLYIKEQQNKISDLEKELKLVQLSEMDKTKEIRCFPHLIQYNYKEDINPKSIPLTKSILKDTQTRKKSYDSNNNTYNQTKSHKDSFLTLTNSNSNIKKKNYICNAKKDYLKTSFNNSFKKYNINDKDRGDELGLKQKKINFEYPMIKSVDLLKQNNLQDDENFNTSSRIKELSRYEEDDNNMNILKEININNIINKEKKYFISHPNLIIAGLSGKTNKYSKGLPNKIFSFKFSKNLQKNAFFKFPSTLKETLVNLEKLRINKNYVNKDEIV